MMHSYPAALPDDCLIKLNWWYYVQLIIQRADLVGVKLHEVHGAPIAQ